MHSIPYNAKLREPFPHTHIMLTLGKDGAVCVDAQQKIFPPIFKVKAVDPAAAGDTLGSTRIRYVQIVGIFLKQLHLFHNNRS